MSVDPTWLIITGRPCTATSAGGKGPGPGVLRLAGGRSKHNVPKSNHTINYHWALLLVMYYCHVIIIIMTCDLHY